MLQIFRDSFGRYVAIAILALIGVTFIFFGIDFSFTRTTYAAKVNGEPIPIQSFEDALRDAQNEYQQALRAELTDELRLVLRRQVLEELISREALLQQARNEGYVVSDERLIEAIRSYPAFQVQGEFSADVYRSQLTAAGFSPAMFEAQQREEASLIELRNAIFDSAFITPAEFRRSIELVYETREIAWAEFAAAEFLDQVEIADEAVAEYHTENADLFMTEEAVDLEVVAVDLESVAATIEISEEDLREYYETESETYAGSEERKVRHILIEIDDDDTDAARAEAESAVERLEAGEDFAALAAEVSDDAGTKNIGGDLGWTSRGVLPGAFEDALFAMEVDETRGPIETAFGFHVIRLDDIRVTDQPPFEAERERIRNLLAADEAYSLYIDRTDELDDVAYDALDDLAAVAEEMGLELEVYPGLTRSNAAGHFDEPTSVIAVAFDEDAIATGENSELITLGTDKVGVVRVAAHHLPEPQPLEEVADRIREQLALEAAGTLAFEAATAFEDALDSAASGDQTSDETPAEAADETPAEAADETPDQAADASPDQAAEETPDETPDFAALAESHGGSWHEAISVRRNSADAAAAIVSRAFSESRPTADAPRVFRVPVGGGNQAVVLLTAVQPGVPADIPTAEREQGRDTLVGQRGEAEFNAYGAAVRQRARVSIPEAVSNPEL